ncbi:MAG TPA: hypothetical protein V6D15_09845 [Oculatellaceae cyanobacterium]|jgi:Spy/CpxP family protein refolding chaperone
MAINRLLVLATVPFVIGGFGFAISDNAVAQSAPTTPNTAQPNGQYKGWGRKFEQLGLSEQQKAQIQQIKTSSRQQMDAVFTAEQKQQFQTARQQRQRPNITLTDAQKSQLQTIQESSKRQIDAVLTDAQRQQLQQLKQQWQQNRQNRQPAQS